MFKYSCLHFSANTFPHLTHPQLPPSVLPPLTLSMGPLYCSLMNLPLLSPHYSPPRLPSGHCQFVLYFTVSGSILLACLFCKLGSTFDCEMGLRFSFPPTSVSAPSPEFKKVPTIQMINLTCYHNRLASEWSQQGCPRSRGALSLLVHLFPITTHL